MPSVELSAQIFARLQAHAVPLVDNIETVIGRLIDFYESRDKAAVPDTNDSVGAKIRQFNPLSPPSLTHTKVLAIEFCGQPLEHGHTNWNGLLIAAVRTAKSRAKTAADLKQLVIIPYFDGRKTSEGYRYLPELGLSVQGQDANGAWRAACHIAQNLGLPLTTRFVWREKDGSAFPGIIGQFIVPGR